MKVKHFAWAGLGALFALSSGSQLHALQKAALQEKLSSSEPVSFDVYLPQQHKKELAQLLSDLQNPSSPQYHQWLTPAQFNSQFGPSSATVKAIKNELSGFGLTATLSSPHLLHVTGPASEVEQALGTPLRHGTMPSGKAVIVATSALSLPNAMSSANAVVTGLAGQVRMHTDSVRSADPQNRYSPSGGYWFDDLKQAYTFPSFQSFTGKGSTIAVLIPSGFSASDMAMYFGHEKLAVPNISVRNVLGGTPFDPTSDNSFEAELDVQQSGGMAPDAHIVLYSIPDLSDESVIAGLVQVVEDNSADVVNMSFGAAELLYSADYNGGQDYSGILVAEDEIMAQGNALGITFVASSGDYGAASVPPVACFETTNVPCGSFLPSVNFPASSPHVTGVGGTNLETVYDNSHPGDLNSAYVSEEAFGDPISADIVYGTAATGLFWASGGGNSIVFAKPDYQTLVKTSAKVRTVPDVSLHMGGCPGVPAGVTVTCSPDDSFDYEVFGGEYAGVIGTSASSPDFAGLTALNIQRQGGRLGNENYYIYTLASTDKNKVFHHNIPGFNGLYTSGNDGYNRVLGNGTIFGTQFLSAPRTPVAGVPQTPSNP
ncbi:MAG: S53 family peptidase [Janthinobacterium lividum]